LPIIGRTENKIQGTDNVILNVLNFFTLAENLSPGEMLFIGDYLLSSNGCFYLAIERNGNLAIHQVSISSTFYAQIFRTKVLFL